MRKKKTYIEIKWRLFDKKNFFSIILFPRSANKCLLKVAHYSAQVERYARAIEIFEQVKLKFYNF
jgi:hypothetical protein